MAETEPCETEVQIQEKTISSQTEELKKLSEDADGNDVEMPLKNGVDNLVEAEENIVEASDSVAVEENPISESNEADCGIADELPSSEGNEADSGTVEEKSAAEVNEADSGIEEEKPSSEAIEADSGTTEETPPTCEEGNEADSGTTKEINIETIESQPDNSIKAESVSSTEAVTNEIASTEETKANGVAEKKEDKAEKKDHSLGSTVAKHYNDISPGTKELRKDSRIFHLRNFNNWIKSVVISEYLEKIKRRKRVSDDINVLDLACGKGGDLLKWQKGKIDHVIMADIAAMSIDQCKERYAKLQKEQRNNRYYRERLFTAEFFAADCTKEKLNELYRRKDIKLDLSSCQFAFHYSFESYEQADMMLKNLCENLRVGGYFIGTTPDAHKLVKHIKACKADSFGNSVFNIKPEDKETFPLFGSKYMFYLEGVVDCPEFIVYLPLLEKMAAKYNMKLVWKKNFHDIFKEYEREHASLLAKMSALEQYPATTAQLAGGSESQYKSAKDYVDKKGNRRVGTLSADEWEVAGLYIAFAFEKMEPPRETRPKEREDRKRPRDDRGSRSQERHHEKRRSESSSTPKRTKKDADTDEVYEIKDEIYEDDNDKVEEKSKSEKSSKLKSKQERPSSRRRSDEATKEKSAEISTDKTSDVPAEKTESKKVETPKVSVEKTESKKVETPSSDVPAEKNESKKVETPSDVPAEKTESKKVETPEVSTEKTESKTVEVDVSKADELVKPPVEAVADEGSELPKEKTEEVPETVPESIEDPIEDMPLEQEKESPELPTVTTPEVEDSKKMETVEDIPAVEKDSESSVSTPDAEESAVKETLEETAAPSETALPEEPMEQ